MRKRTAQNVAPAPEASPRPYLLLQTIAGRQLVNFCSPHAHAAGIKPAMTLAQAKALCADVEYDTWRPDLDQKAREALARYLIRFTPAVALLTRDIAQENEPPSQSCIFLDLTGCEHLHGGLEPMLRVIAQSLHRLHIPATLAVADTPGAAFALGHLPPHKNHKDTTGVRTLIAKSFQALAQVPVSGLRLPANVLESLHHLGLETIGQLQSLPRESLPQRFGRRILLRLDQLSGRIPEPLITLDIPVSYQQRRDFDGSVSDPQALEQVFQDLLAPLLLQLERRGEGARQLLIALEREDIGDRSPPQTFTLNVSRPSRDARALTGLFRCALEQITTQMVGRPGKAKSRYSLNFDAGFTAMQLTITRAQALPHEQLNVDEQDRPSRRSAWQSTLDLIRARLGESAIQQAALLQSYLPEKAFLLKPAQASEQTDAPADQIGDRPLRLLSPPQEIQVMVAPSQDGDGVPLSFRLRGTVHKLTQAAGPERVAGQWWEGHLKTRDYFDVADDAGLRFWLFRVLETGKWYLHGNFT